MNTTTRWVSFVAAALWIGCGGAPAATEPSTALPPAGGEQQGTAESLSNLPAETAAATPAEPAPPPVTVVAGTPTPLPDGLRPRVQITAPRNDQVLRTNSVEVRLRVTDWPAPQDGRHIHLILDNNPYQRIDDPSRPIRLTDLAEGTHVLRAFPGWASHESVKRDGAFAMTVFHVGRRTADFPLRRNAPLLTYSRPKGEYNGADADRILLDFYLTNIPNNQLSPTGYRVRYAIDGSTTGELTDWVPYYIEHLADGPHTITLDLLGPDGQSVQNAFNPTERTITVNRGTAATDEHAHGAH